MAISLIIGRINERMSWKQSEEDSAADQLTPFKLGGGRLSQIQKAIYTSVQPVLTLRSLS